MENLLNKYLTGSVIAMLLVVNLLSCKDNDKKLNTAIEEVAGNEEVLSFMQTFAGRGALSDSSLPVDASEAVSAFKLTDDLAIELVLAEPIVSQPLFMNFDHRGRLWVVQYNQYPYPAGLKVMSMDQHIRAKFDKSLLPPPQGVEGASKITIFEDADGNGSFEKSTDAIKGLNLSTSVAIGRGKIWVLNPPYLLAYPDPDNDGIPDGQPVVHLKGFGIEDTHAIANNLRWGPDGWLYGAQGSTCTADVSSAVTKGVRFNGQGIWRYHPQTQVFEVFAEGGGNTFDVEIDDKGRIYSGDNGSARGQYYKQGGYFPKTLGKHGVYTNPYAFGNLKHMELNGDTKRFTHAFIRYQGGTLPARFDNRMIALNPLQSYIQLTRFEEKGSSFLNVDEEKIVVTADRWFRPVDIVTGPDGAVYVADWYDSRLSHVDPRDTWSKTTGRIYRLKSKGELKPQKFDLSRYSNDQLIGLLSHKNKWFRQQALQQFGERKDATVIPKLLPLFNSTDGQSALEALWAINLSGGFNEKLAIKGLEHPDPFVRMWTVRLLGDAKKVSGQLASVLVKVASSEMHAEVRSQLASTAKRLKAADGIPVVKALLKQHDDSADPDLPLQLWWALESKTESDRGLIMEVFKDKEIWNRPTVMKTILARLMQRYIIAGGTENFKSCADLLKMTPSESHAAILINGLQEGLRGRDVTALSPELMKALKPYQKLFKEESLALDLRQGQKQALEKALSVIADKEAMIGQRLTYIRILGEVNKPEVVPVLLKLVESAQSSGAIQQAALLTLQRYDQDEIGKRVVKAYPDKLRADPDVRAAALALFASRPSWAAELLNAIDRKKQKDEKFIAHTIAKEDIPDQLVRQLKLLNDPNIVQTTERLWPNVRLATSPEKNGTIARISALMKTGRGDILKGKPLFMTKCGSCHKLFDEGGIIGPDLTGYDRSNLADMLTNIVDPSAYIREGYGTDHITTKDGRTIVGTIKARNASLITIQPFTGDPVSIGTSQVKEIKEQKTSLMPERLLEGMNNQEIKDMISYLMKKG